MNNTYRTTTSFKKTIIEDHSQEAFPIHLAVFTLVGNNFFSSDNMLACS